MSLPINKDHRHIPGAARELFQVVLLIGQFGLLVRLSLQGTQAQELIVILMISWLIAMFDRD